MRSELKPCPFCGGNPVHSGSYPTNEGIEPEAVECEACFARVYEWGEETAVEAWQRREQDADLAAMRERAERAERERDAITELAVTLAERHRPSEVMGESKVWFSREWGLRAVRAAVALDAPAAPPEGGTP